MSKVVKAAYTAEAVAGFTHRTALEEAARCLLCHDAPCSKGCPAGTDPAKFIRSIRFRNVRGAAETIRENNILGGSCARVCPYDRLCEEACSRCGIDRPIEIGKLQRYAIEAEEVFGMKTLVAGEDKPGKVACIGAGPASLAVAAEIRKAGYAVTIFEKEEKAGGMLTYGIVPSRLPQHVIDHDIAQVEGLGVNFEYGKKVTIADVEADYDAVFVGTGLWATKKPPIDGADLEGAIAAADYLKAARTTGTQPGKKVVVIGGGDVAVDCAVTAKLLGAEDVRIVYRRTLEEAPGNMEEFKYALELGVGITTNMAPAAITGDGKVEAITFTGREGVLDGSELKIACDTVVFAIGQAPEAVEGVEANAKGGVAAEAGKTNVAKVFAAGDIVNGGKTVVEAVAAGKEAAAAIIEYLQK